MSKSENFKDYPKILKIEDDGKIIALDKNGQINTDLNIHTIDDDKQRLVFGKVIYNPYSRTERNYDDYNKRPEDYYNQRDREREWQLQQENKKAKSKSKWLGILLTIAIVVIVGIIAMNFLSNKNLESNSEVANNEQVQQQNEQLKQEIDDTKEELKNSQNNEQQTQQSINELQTKVDNLKQNNQNQSAANEFQDGLNQLQEAQNSKENGNKNEMKEQLKQVEDKIDTEKISEESKNQWEKFKSWLNDNF